MKARIHPTALVDPGAKLGEEVVIGPFAVIESGVEIGDGCSIGAHAVVHSGTRLGKRNRIFAHTVLGGEPQDLKFAGQPTRLEMGDDNLVREFVTLNRGTEEGGGVTRVGNKNLFMAYSHVAHDCVVGDEVVMANSVALGGHVVVEDQCVIGGLTGVHQFARVGKGAMVGGISRVSKDVLPFSITSGNDETKVYGLNKVGLKRRGISKEDLAALEKAYRTYLDPALNGSEALKALEALAFATPHVIHLCGFIQGSSRGVTR
ncbi:MAG: acyl-ACP--UDP-N-acetylglucosamine O-acyltransferase [candidate division FCPU426 bacterium]